MILHYMIGRNSIVQVLGEKLKVAVMYKCLHKNMTPPSLSKIKDRSVNPVFPSYYSYTLGVFAIWSTPALARGGLEVGGARLCLNEKDVPHGQGLATLCLPKRARFFYLGSICRSGVLNKQDLHYFQWF